jgi:predicted metal-dependent enzyme (double-stranded beta helix superfamily)
MQQVAFNGIERLVEVLDRGVARGDAEAITQAIKDGLCGLIREGGVELPPQVRRPGTDSYGRHLLYRSDEHGYVVVAMAWGPGQGTPVHDHAGIWCVEAVCEGEMTVVQYDLVEQDGERFRFEPQGTVQSGPGAGGALIPPFDYHTLANAGENVTAITLHVYGRDLERCAIFEPLPDGWHRRLFKDLSYSS